MSREDLLNSWSQRLEEGDRQIEISDLIIIEMQPLEVVCAGNIAEGSSFILSQSSLIEKNRPASDGCKESGLYAFLPRYERGIQL